MADADWEKYGDNDTFWNLMDKVSKIAKNHGNYTDKTLLKL